MQTRGCGWGLWGLFVAMGAMGVLAWATSGDVPSAATRPTYRDISLKVLDADPSYPFRWFRGHTASQVERDAMETALDGQALPEAIRFARATAGCSTAAKTALVNLTKITTKLGPIYEGNALFPGGRWIVSLSGRHYHLEQYALRAIRTCALGGANACGQSPLMTHALQDLLDLQIVNRQCVAGAEFLPTPPAESYDAARGSTGEVNSSVRQPGLDPRQTALLGATMDAHTQVSNFRCGVGGTPPPDIVTRTHAALEATAVTETEHHFLSMKGFSGAVDPQWAPEEVCHWARLQDRFHQAWMEAVEAGDWGASRQAETDHQLAHICMGIKDTRVQVRFSCGATISSCPVQTCAQALATL